MALVSSNAQAGSRDAKDGFDRVLIALAAEALRDADASVAGEARATIKTHRAMNTERRNGYGQAC